MIVRMTSKDSVFHREWNIRDGYSQWYRKPHLVGPPAPNVDKRKYNNFKAKLTPLQHP